VRAGPDGRGRGGAGQGGRRGIEGRPDGRRAEARGSAYPFSVVGSII